MSDFSLFESVESSMKGRTNGVTSDGNRHTSDVPESTDAISALLKNESNAASSYASDISLENNVESSSTLPSLDYPHLATHPSCDGAPLVGDEQTVEQTCSQSFQNGHHEQQNIKSEPENSDEATNKAGDTSETPMLDRQFIKAEKGDDVSVNSYDPETGTEGGGSETVAETVPASTSVTNASITDYGYDRVEYDPLAANEDDYSYFVAARTAAAAAASNLSNAPGSTSNGSGNSNSSAMGGALASDWSLRRGKSIDSQILCPVCPKVTMFKGFSSISGHLAGKHGWNAVQCTEFQISAERDAAEEEEPESIYPGIEAALAKKEDGYLFVRCPVRHCLELIRGVDSLSVHLSSVHRWPQNQCAVITGLHNNLRCPECPAGGKLNRRGLPISTNFNGIFSLTQHMQGKHLWTWMQCAEHVAPKIGTAKKYLASVGMQLEPSSGLDDDGPALSPRDNRPSANYRCPECNQPVFDLSTLQNHMLVKHAWSFELFYHYNMVFFSQSNSFFCPTCPANRFKNRSSLRQHLEGKHQWSQRRVDDLYATSSAKVITTAGVPIPGSNRPYNSGTGAFNGGASLSGKRKIDDYTPSWGMQTQSDYSKRPRDYAPPASVAGADERKSRFGPPPSAGDAVAAAVLEPVWRDSNSNGSRSRGGDVSPRDLPPRTSSASSSSASSMRSRWSDPAGELAAGGSRDTSAAYASRLSSQISYGTDSRGNGGAPTRGFDAQGYSSAPYAQPHSQLAGPPYYDAHAPHDAYSDPIAGHVALHPDEIAQAYSSNTASSTGTDVVVDPVAAAAAAAAAAGVNGLSNAMLVSAASAVMTPAGLFTAENVYTAARKQYPHAKFSRGDVARSLDLAVAAQWLAKTEEGYVVCISGQ